MSIRDNLKEFVTGKAAFEDADEATKEMFLNEASSKRSNLLEYLASDEEYLSLDEPTRRQFLAGIAPEYFDTGAITEVERPLTSTLASGIEGQIGIQAAGLAQFAYDYNPAHISRKLAEYMGAEPNPETAALDASVQGSIAALRDMAVEEQKQYELGAQNMGFISRAGLDIGVDLLAGIPTIAAMFAGGPVAAGAMGAAQMGAVEYGDVRSKKYNPLEAAMKALPSAVIGGLGAAVSAGAALDPSKPLARKLVRNAIIDAGVGFTAPVIDAATDWMVDSYYKTKQEPLLAEGLTPWEVMKNALYGSFVNASSGAFMTAAPDMVRFVKMRVNGLKETLTKDGQVIVHPVEMTDSVDAMVDKTDFTGMDAQQVYDQSEANIAVIDRTVRRLTEIEETQKSRPLDELDLDPQAGPSKKGGRLKLGMEVDVSPKYFTEKDNKPRNMGIPAKVVRNTYPVEESIQQILPGGVSPVTTTKKSLFVDVEFYDEPGVTYTIPRGQIVEKTQTPNSVPFEAPRLVRFMSDLFFPRDIPTSEWTADNARMALGGFLGVNEKLSWGNLAQVKGTKGQIVWDAMRNNPEDAARILSHEPGHILANADPKVLAAMNIPEFDGFKRWITETMQSSDPDVVNRYNFEKQKNPDLTLEEFILTEKYGDELNQLWEGWELFKGSKANPEELVANALSVYMNDVLGPEALPGFRQMKIRADLSDWIDSQPNLALAFEGLRAYDFSTPGSVNAAANDMFVKAKQALAGAAEAEEGVKKTFLQQTADNFQDRMYSFLDRVKRDPALVDRYEGSLMTPGRAAHYVERSFGTTYKTLNAHDIDPGDYRNYTFFKRILGDRTKIVERLSGESDYATMEDYHRAFNEESQRIRSDIKGNNPDFSDKDLELAVQAHMKMFAETSVVEGEVQMHNPGGFTKATAAAGLAELAKRYGPEKYAVIEQRHKAEHDAFVELGIPILRESKMFSETILNHMENNPDYATFVVAHHAFNSRKNNGKNKGSLNFIHEQMGTLGFIDDPHVQTNLLRARMIMAADQAGMQRDLVEGSAAFEAKHFPDAPRTRLLAPGEEPRSGYDLFQSQKYNSDTGKVEEVRYEAKKGALDGFDKVAHDNYMLSGLNFIHGSMKGWMTVFNPRFWIRNFALDLARSVINAPGLRSYEIIPAALSALKQDLKYRWKGAENPEYLEMMLARQIAGDARAQHTLDRSLSPHDRIMMMADLNPKFYNKTWKDINGVFDKLHYLYDLSTSGWKKGATFIGSSTEFASKAGMKRYLAKRFPKMSQEDVNWYIRNAAGTPLQSRSGKWNPYLSNLVLFYNPNMQGVVSDIQAFKRDPYNNIIKRAAAVAGHTMLLAAARKGLLNEDLKKWAEAIPKYLHTRGFNIPLMFSADGDAGTLTLPTDVLTRTMLAAGYQTMNKMLNGTFSVTDIGGSILGEATEGAPSLAPVWQSILSGAEYLKGDKNMVGNPEDFMGVPAMSKELQESNDTWTQKAAMLTHFMQQGWGGPFNAMGFTPLIRAQFETRVKKPNVETPTTPEKINSILKTFLKVPIVGYSLGGLVKFSSAGLQELAEDRASPGIAQHASERRVVQQAVDTLFAGGEITPDEAALMKDERHKRFATHRAKMLVDLDKAAKLNRSDLTPLIKLLKQNPREELADEYYLMLLERMGSGK